MSNIIRQHYVPQRYLRYFAIRSQKKSKDIFRFYAFDKVCGDSRSGNVADYAQERYFYDVNFEALEKIQLENDPSFQLPEEIRDLIEKVDPQRLLTSSLSFNSTSFSISQSSSIIATFLYNDIGNFLYISTMQLRNGELNDY